MGGSCETTWVAANWFIGAYLLRTLKPEYGHLWSRKKLQFAFKIPGVCVVNGPLGFLPNWPETPLLYSQQEHYATTVSDVRLWG